jgi:predicted DNA-binding ribbon-helix-helix protein
MPPESPAPTGGVLIRPDNGVVKRSLVVAGHRTSISLEEAFWRELKALAGKRAQSINALVAEIDASRGRANLSSAIRVYLFENVIQ